MTKALHTEKMASSVLSDRTQTPVFYRPHMGMAGGRVRPMLLETGALEWARIGHLY